MGALATGGLLLWGASAAAQTCPVGTVVTVDNDTPGSGYSEVKPQNWLDRNVGACTGNYRYLSHTVGDGSRTGKAIWTPSVPADGWYRVVTSFRATENRTNDADYYLYGDDGSQRHVSIDQTVGSDCTTADLDTIWCTVGGNCRLELDGDDGKSDSADVTTFTLEGCTPGGSGGTGGGSGAGRCDGIRANSSYEVCGETDTTCTGVYTDGSGCAAFCAAAGMTCTARFGGEPGCQKEAQTSIACNAQNGHGSDWCECSGPPLMGSGGAAGTPGAGGSGATGTAGSSSGGAAGGDVPDGGWQDSGMPSGGSAWGGNGGLPSSGGSAGAPSRGSTEAADDGGGCGCRTPNAPAHGGWVALLVGLLATVRRRR